MKKLLGIVVMSLLLSGNAYADLIMFDKCYPVPNFKSYKTYKNSSESAFDEWSMEINLKKDKITRTTIWKDEEVESGKKMGLNIKKIDIETLPILSSTSKYVVSEDGDFEYTLSIKTGQIQIYFKPSKSTDLRQCDVD